LFTPNLLMNLFFKILVLGVIIMAQNCDSKEYRSSSHAGTWYPGTEKELKGMIQTFLKNARAKVHGDIYGLVSPHAGYVYSGPVAAFAYKTLEGMAFDDVIVIGPSHHYGFFGASVDTMSGRETPLGKVDFDLELARKIIKYNKNITHDPSAHTQEHSTEIQIPFLQSILKKFKLIEIVMGTQDFHICEILSEAIVKSIKNKKVLIVASSDLSHYHPQKEAESLDNLVIDAVGKYDPELLFNRLSKDSCEACGGGPIITTMLITKELGATKAKPVVYATSGNITGDYSQVVGYLAVVFYKGEEMEVGVDLGFTNEEKAKIKEIAKKSVEAAVKGKELPTFKNIPKKLKEPYGIFVTLNKHGSLRGCIGRIIGDQPLYVSCQMMAKAAALEDPRFPPVTENELKDLEIEISILTPLEEVKNFDDIVVGRDGLYIVKGYYSGLLLPQVAAEYGWSVGEFLEETCHKAGLPSDAYKANDAKVFKFSAEVF
jgi:AmmeMemoRadiSam system protein B/AmmeMemoRadiSam system protein A